MQTRNLSEYSVDFDTRGLDALEQAKLLHDDKKEIIVEDMLGHLKRNLEAYTLVGFPGGLDAQLDWIYNLCKSPSPQLLRFRFMTTLYLAGCYKVRSAAKLPRIPETITLPGQIAEQMHEALLMYVDLFHDVFTPDHDADDCKGAINGCEQCLNAPHVANAQSLLTLLGQKLYHEREW